MRCFFLRSNCCGKARRRGWKQQLLHQRKFKYRRLILVDWLDLPVACIEKLLTEMVAWQLPLKGQRC